MEFIHLHKPSFQVVLSGLLAVAIFWFYRPVLEKLFSQLAGSKDYSYGLLLPLVSIYVACTKLPEIRRLPWQPSWKGLVVMFVGLCLYIFGELAADLFIPRTSFLVVLAGICLVLGGWPALKLFSFPLLLLFLMLPLPGFIIKQLTIPLQLVSSQVATWFLQTVGVPAIRYGNIIDLGLRQLEVVSACSGLVYLLSLIAVGAIFCYFFQPCFWKAAVLMVATIPAAIIANALRVAGVGLFSAWQQGFWHTLSGFLVFVSCFGFLSLINLFMNYVRPPGAATGGYETPPEVEPFPVRRRKSAAPYLIVALALTLLACPLAAGLSRVPPVPLRQSLVHFPLHLGHWQGRRLEVEPGLVKAIRADAVLSAEYLSPGRQPVSLWLAYYENQQTSTGIHSPFACLQGSGWRILKSAVVEVGPGLPVNYLLMDYLGNRSLVYYWFIQRGRWMRSEYLGKLFMAYDRVVGGRADGMLVRLIMPAGSEEPLARHRLTAFARLLLPVLPQFLVMEPRDGAIRLSKRYPGPGKP